MNWNFSGFNKVFKISFWLLSIKNRHIEFYSGNKSINNINSMFKTSVEQQSEDMH